MRNARQFDADVVLVSRLLEFYDPFPVLNLDELEIRLLVPVVVSEPRFNDGNRPPLWDARRIAFFVEELWSGRRIDPIEVDANCDRGHVYGPTLLDGHHRLCAAKIAAVEKIAVYYGGRLDVLNYLNGKRKNCPGDL